MVPSLNFKKYVKWEVPHRTTLSESITEQEHIPGWRVVFPIRASKLLPKAKGMSATGVKKMNLMSTDQRSSHTGRFVITKKNLRGRILNQKEWSNWGKSSLHNF